MAYQYITRHDSPNYTSGRHGRKVRGIVIHWWDDPSRKPTFDGVVQWLCRPGGSSSAHYVVEAGKVACIVSPANTAWHAGNYFVNTETIGIECNPRMSAGDLQTVAEVIADIRNHYGYLPLSTHKNYDTTTCPGTYVGKIDWLDAQAETLRGDKTRPKSVLAVDGWLGPHTVRALQKLYKTPIDGLISSQPSDLKPLHAGINPSCIAYVPRAQAQGSQLILAIQKALNKQQLYSGAIDGSLGPGTIKGLQRYYGTPADGVISAPSRLIIAMQRSINQHLTKGA